MTDARDRGGAIEYRVRVAPGEDGARLDRVLAAGLAELSRSRVKALILAGHVSSGGATISDPDHRVKPGQTFAILVPDTTPARPQAQDIALDVVYEDEDLIVIDKPAGLVVHPAPGNPDHTLVNALIAHCGDSLSGIGGERRPGIVHRLDKDTSGLMVAAKNDRAHTALSAQFQARTIERAYTALVWGVPRRRAGEIEGAIGRHPKNRKKMAIVARGGREALTRYKMAESFGDVASRLECRLATGRTHQIRVHLAHFGHPVIGDPVYGGNPAGRRRALSPAARAAIDDFRRQALHAHLIGFDHPIGAKHLIFESPIPPDMAVVLAALKTD